MPKSIFLACSTELQASFRPRGSIGDTLYLTDLLALSPAHNKALLSIKYLSNN